MQNKRDIGYRIKKISDLMEQRANAELKEVDLTFAQMQVLHYLYEKRGHQARLKEVERFFRVSQPTMAGIAVRLEEKGFISSCADAADKRIKILSLSEKGMEVCRKTQSRMTKKKNKTVEALGRENADELCRLLDLLYTHLSSDGKETDL